MQQSSESEKASQDEPYYESPSFQAELQAMQLLDETESHRNYSLPGWTFGLLALLVISLILLLLPTIPHHLDLTRFAPSRSEAMSAIVEKNEYCTPDDILRSVKLDRIVDSFDYTLSHEEAAESLVLDSTGPCELRIISASDAIHLVSFLIDVPEVQKLLNALEMVWEDLQIARSGDQVIEGELRVGQEESTDVSLRRRGRETGME